MRHFKLNRFSAIAFGVASALAMSSVVAKEFRSADTHPLDYPTCKPCCTWAN